MLLTQKKSIVARPIADSHLQMTEKEFVDWCDDDTHAEWVDGSVVLMSPVTESHAEYSSFFNALLRVFLETNQAGRVLQEPFQMRLSSQKRRRSPDAIVVRQENLKRIGKNQLNGPADLVLEVISRGTRSVDYREKFAEYELAGVGEYWIVDPATRELQVYLHGRDNRFSLIKPTKGWLASKVLPGFAFKLAWLDGISLPAVMDCLRQIRRRKSK